MVLKGPGEVCYGACPIALAKQNLVWVIVNVVVRERLEKLYRFIPMVLFSLGWLWLSGQVYFCTFGVAFDKGVPVLNVSCIIQGLHQL